MASHLNTVRILDVEISCTRRETILQLPQKWAAESGKRTIMYANAHCLNLSANDPTYRAILNTADLVYADGISIVWAAKFLNGCTLEKTTGATGSMIFVP